MERKMEKDIFFVCKCLNKAFTQEEWWEYCKSHYYNSRDEVVFRYKTYEYNINDVCLTPNTPIDLEVRGCKIIISTCENPMGKWDYGIAYDLSKCGGSGFCRGARYEGKYYNERDAIYAALVDIEQAVLGLSPIQGEYDDEGIYKQTNNSAIIKAIVSEIAKIKDRYSENQLFEFA